MTGPLTEPVADPTSRLDMTVCTVVTRASLIRRNNILFDGRVHLLLHFAIWSGS